MVPIKKRVKIGLWLRLPRYRDTPAVPHARRLLRRGILWLRVVERRYMSKSGSVNLQTELAYELVPRSGSP